jgi:hypothetical protein
MVDGFYVSRGKCNLFLFSVVSRKLHEILGFL